MSYHNNNNSTSTNNTNQRTSNTSSNTSARFGANQPIAPFAANQPIAPPGFHFMADGTLMSDAEHARLGIVPHKTITTLDLDLSDIPGAGESRLFNIIGSDGAKFRLEIKDNTSGYYYNFITNIFQLAPAYLEKSITGGFYSGSILFPSVTEGDDQYDVFLYAIPGTIHQEYNEVRFGDGSLDINSSTGSNSLMMTKVIYQYAALTLTLAGYSPYGTVAGTFATDTISIDRGKQNAKVGFSFTTTAGTTAAYRLLNQPTQANVLAFVEPVVGDEPITLVGENIHPAITTAANSASEGGTTVNGASTGRTVTTHVVSSTIATVGDRVLGNAALAAEIVTVSAVSGGSGKTFTISESTEIADDLPLTFSNQMNHSWPIDNYANLISNGMIVVDSAEVTAGTMVGSYRDVVVSQRGTVNEKVIVKNVQEAIDTLSKKPTIVKNLVTVQEGQATFNKQQKLSFGGLTLKVGGYGENNILRLYGWDVRFSDLKIALTAPTTKTTEATSAHATIAVASKEGVINGVSTVGGIGINPLRNNPIITSGGGATGSGDWVMQATQSLESGATLIVENTSRIATITGNIQVVKAGTASQTLRFDVEKLLSTSAP